MQGLVSYNILISCKNYGSFNEEKSTNSDGWEVKGQSGDEERLRNC
jgi:hypothetical protein